MFPPQAIAQQQQQPMQQQGAPRKSRAKWYALGGVVVIGAIITIAIVATRKDPATEGYNELWIIALEKNRDKICACKDEPCVHDALQDIDKRHRELDEHLDIKGDQKKQQHDLMEEIGKCVDKVPGTDKPHKAPAGPAAFKDVMQDLSDMRDKMCKCPGSGDPYCAAQVKADFESTIRTSKALLSDSTLGADDQKTLEAAIVQILACEESAKKGRN